MKGSYMKFLLALCAFSLVAQTPPQTLTLTPAQLTIRQNIELQFEQLRMTACWEAGWKKDECGQWINFTTIMKNVPQAAQPAQSAPIKAAENPVQTATPAK
jgi:hypothetical protein